MMDYKNILEGTRPFFQGLPMPLPSPNPSTTNSIGGTTPVAHQSPISQPLQNSQQNNPHRMKFEEGLGATLTQMYNTVSPTLRIPASSSSPKNGPSPSGGHGLNSTSPGRDREHHLNLRGGSSASIPPATPASSVLNIPFANTLSSSSSAPRTNSGGGGRTQNGGPVMGIRRESPLDLSVKTVRQSADSSTNNTLDGAIGQCQGLSSASASNCVVNSTGGAGTRSLSSSRASTPNNTSNNGGGSGNNNVSSVIAAAANSTTGRDKDIIGRVLLPSPSHNLQNSPLHQPAGTVESVPAHTQPSPQSHMGSSGGYPPPSQSHHLFGVGNYNSPSAVISIPGGHGGVDPSKMFSHHYLHQQVGGVYRPPTPQQQPTGSHNFQSSLNSNSSLIPSIGSNQNQSGSSSSSGSSTSTPTATTNTQSQPASHSRPSSSVIPPYNPPQPTFGLGAYHQQPTSGQLTQHLPYHPHTYGSYHIQQPGPGPGGQSPHPYYSGHYGTPSAHTTQAHTLGGTSTSVTGNTLTTSSPIPNRSSGSNHQINQKNNHEVLQSQPASHPSASSYQQNHGSGASGTGKGISTQSQLYGHPQIAPNASTSAYTAYPQYYSPHLGIEDQRPPVTNQSQSNPASQQSRQSSVQYPVSYPYAHAQSPHYGNSHPTPPTNYSNHYPPPEMAGGRSPHPSQMAGGMSPHPSQMAGGTSPHPSQIAGGRSPHPSQMAGGKSPHPSQMVGGRSPHPSQMAGGRSSQPSQMTGGKSPHPSHIAGGKSPHPSQLAGGTSPHPSQIAGGKSPHPSQLAGGTSPHPSQIAGGKSPHPSQLAGGTSPHPSQIAGGKSPHPSQLAGGTSPHPSQMAGGNSPHPSQLAGGTSPHPSQLAGGTSPHPSQLAGGTSPHPSQMLGGKSPHPSHMAGGTSPHPSNQIQSHYYSYMHPITPRPIPPPQTMSTNRPQFPSGYAYPSHLTGPRPPAPNLQQTSMVGVPPPLPPPPTVSAYQSSTPLNVPIPVSNVPTPAISKSPAKNGRSNGGPKTGEKRKNLLNLLRNSLETRIHEKQEKEKVNHRQTWNFHGKKYHNPLPPPNLSGAMTSPGNASGGGGSIVTGVSHQSENNGNVLGNGDVGAYPGLFGINQRTNFVERQAAQGALSPNTENSLNRIRTKAEKKQVFPNLLSQIEQENANKQQQLQLPFTNQRAQQNQSVHDKYNNYTANNSSAKTSVFDFQDEEEETRANLSLSRRSPGHSTSPVASTSSSIIPPLPKRRSGSKKFTSKLNKWVPPVGVPPAEKMTTGDVPVPALKSEISVIPVPTTTAYNETTVTGEGKQRVPAIDNMDEFWATCDSFLDDLSANPTTIKSRRGGLWAKLKSTTPKEGKKSKGRRRRRPSAEVDADFQIEEEAKSDDEDGGEEEEREQNSDSDSSSSSSEDEEEVKSNSSNSSLDVKIQSNEGMSEEPGNPVPESDDDKKESSDKGQSDTELKTSPTKRKSSGKIEVSSPPHKKSKRGASKHEVKGRKVGKRFLRERRTGSLVGKSMSDLDDQLSGESEDGDDDSDVSIASFSISSDDSRSLESDSETDTNNSSDSDADGKSSESEREGEDRSTESKGPRKKVKKKKGRSSSAKGRRKLERRRSTRSTRNSSQKSGKPNDSTGSGVRDQNSKREGKRDKRKLRPTRNCAKGKVKDASGESEEERGSSGEEWIMRGELGKRKREKSRIVYGDGSEFRRPGWEEELIDFKKKLRMPSKLIRVAKPSSLSSTPSGKGKEDAGDTPALQPVVVISPAKSTKENKSPTKGVSLPVPPVGETEVQPPLVHVVKKGRPPKVRTPQKEGDIGGEKGKKTPKTPKGKKIGGKKIRGESPPSGGSGTKSVTGEKTPAGKRRGKKVKLSDTVNGDSVSKVVHHALREERDKGMAMLPTPGPAGVKFNKKMSIKSVFGVDIPTSSGSGTATPVPVTPDTNSVQASPVVNIPKKALRRNKFKSGFDYIRKKKKTAPDGTGAPPPPKRSKISQEKNVTEDDVQNELRCWVLNKGLGETILHRAARLGYPDVAAYTLEHDICSPNCKDNAGYSPLHETCMKGNLEVAKILLAYGANPSQAAPGGIRPLHEACENGHVELVRLLISFGADPLLATYAGQTPIELAAHHKPVKKLLEQHIRDVQGKEEKPWEFRGSGKWADDWRDSGFDVTEEPPTLPRDNTDLEDGFEFEASELPLPPIYMLKEDVPYILLQDLINFLGLPKDRILKTHVGAELVELNSNDFLEDVHCRALLGVKFRLNLSSDLLVLIKYDDVVKKMLNIESCFIK